MNPVEAFPSELPNSVAQALPVAPSRWSGLNTIQAIAGVVLREMCRRKDFYVLFFLTALITVAFGSASFFGETDITRYLKEICLQLIWVASLVIAITSTSRQIPAEREARTLFPLLAKPVTRNQLVMGKFLGCWLASGLALLVFYLFFVIISGLREQAWPLAAYAQAVVLHWFLLGIVVTMTLLGSVVFAAPSSNNTITFVVIAGILFLARYLNRLALGLEEPAQSIVYSIYYVIPHLEWFDSRDRIIHDLGALQWVVWCEALAYAVVYGAMFLTAACLVFRRKPVN